VEWITARRTSAPRISIRRVPTVRDADGLALSSRNARLSPAGRTAAAAIPRALDAARDALARGASTVAQVRAAALHLLSQHSELTLEYLDLADPHTLEALPESEAVNEALLTIAVAVDGVRLLDERLLGERSAS
jgi:pantoate--beta-alanine ligase